MRQLTPKVFCIGETALHEDQLQAYLDSVGAGDWESDAPSGAEKLAELMGRLCYRSWKPGLNPNVTRVRKGNEGYLGHIIEVGHGSVLEHPMTHWILSDVSRVFTHELVRHRAGMAFSQESLRFVRLTDLGFWLPPAVESDPEMKALFEETFENLEKIQLRMAEHLNIDEEKKFAIKKEWTSAMRRIAPIGLATTIGVSMNIRALRHIVSMRTHESAEAELRLVIDQLMQIASQRWPNFFSDFSRAEDGAWTTPHPKV
jgi:thymidylate synthase (FAD)